MQGLLTFPGHLSLPPVFSGVLVTRSLVLCVCFEDRRLSFFFWPLCCLFFVDLRIPITLLVSLSSSCIVASLVIVDSSSCGLSCYL